MIFTLITFYFNIYNQILWYFENQHNVFFLKQSQSQVDVKLNFSWCFTDAASVSSPPVADQPGPEHPAPEGRVPAGRDPRRRGPGPDPPQSGQPHLHVLPGCSLHSLSNPVAPISPLQNKSPFCHLQWGYYWAEQQHRGKTVGGFGTKGK